MEIITIVIIFLFPLALGFVVVAFLERKGQAVNLGEKVALSFALGTGLLSFYIFYLGLLGVRFAFGSILPLFIVTILFGLLLIRKRGWRCFFSQVPRRPFGPLKNSEKIIGLFICLLLLCKILFIGFMVLSKPTYFDDSVSNHNFKAKVFFYNRGLVFDPEHPDFLGGHKAYYPYGVPLIKVWISICRGRWEEAAANLYTFFAFLSLGLIAYHNLVRILKPFTSLIFTYLLLSIPLLTFHAASAYVDLIVGWYFFSGIVYLIRWMREGERAAYYLSALLFSIGFMVKNEMLALFSAGVLPVLVIYQRANRMKIRKVVQATAGYLGLVMILNIPWFLLKRIYHLTVGLPHHRKFEFHPEAFQILASYFLGTGNYNILWIVFFCSLFFSAFLIAKTELKYSLIPIAGALAVILSLFIFTPFFEFLKIGTTINRAMLSVLPVVVFYLANLYGELVGEKSTISRKRVNKRSQPCK